MTALRHITMTEGKSFYHILQYSLDSIQRVVSLPQQFLLPRLTVRIVEFVLLFTQNSSPFYAGPSCKINSVVDVTSTGPSTHFQALQRGIPILLQDR